MPAAFKGDAAAVVALLRERAGRRLDVADADEKGTVRPRRAVIESEAFRALWARVRDRTTYRVDFDSKKLVDACVRELQGREPVERARVVWEVGDIEVERGGVEVSTDVERDPRYVDEVGVAVPDAVGLLQERTGLTRATVAAVLTASGRAGELKRNPQATIKLVGDVIEDQKQAAMVDGIRYERTGEAWAQTLFDKEFKRDLTRLMLADERCVTESVPVDSEVEKSFLRELMAAKASVKLYAKLPREFKVPTPLGGVRTGLGGARRAGRAGPALLRRRDQGRAVRVRAARAGERQDQVRQGPLRQPPRGPRTRGRVPGVPDARRPAGPLLIGGNGHRNRPCSGGGGRQACSTDWTR